MSRAAVLVALCLSACIERGPAKSTSVADSYEVERMFDHDGCAVFRFRDTGRYHYFVRCGSEQGTMQHVSCGKNCVRPEDVPTVFLDK